MKGKIDEFLPKIKQRLSLRFPVVDAVFSPDIDGAEGLATKFAGKYDIIVSCGGDGTLHQVINGIMKSGASPLLGILPFGTCNDVAKTLGISFNLDKAIDAILRLNITKYDLMNDGENYISYSLATGYLTKSTYSTTNKQKRKFGRFAYFLSALRSVFKMEKLPITVSFDNERIHGKFTYLMLINGESAGGFRLNKGDVVDDGKVKLVLIKRKNPIISFFVFMRLFMFGIKAIRKSKYAIVKDVESVCIENHANSPFTIDGEKAKFLKKTISVVTTLDIIKN